MVSIRPHLCWILITNTTISVEGDGSGGARAFNRDGKQLDPTRYPHVPLNLNREEWPERGRIIQGNLLQEYTRALSQKEANSVKEISQQWEDGFPELHESLEDIVEDELHDIFHFHVTLDVQEPDQFPEASDFNALIEITIEQAALQNHNWKSVTRLTRPRELTRGSKSEPAVVEVTKRMGSQYMHRPGCENRKNLTSCNCSQTSRLRRQQMAVPFPADEWAVMLSQLATYRRHPVAGRRKTKEGHGEDGTTQMELMQRVAMFQELWSSPQEGQPWSRRAAIIWTFETAYAFDDKAMKYVKTQPGTNWRFLTTIDPTSSWHQKQAVVSSKPTASKQSRDGVLSPHPGFQEHANASMSENFGSTWNSIPHGLPIPTHTHTAGHSTYDNTASMGLLEPFPSAVSTPTSLGSLSTAYPPPSFDSSFGAQHLTLMTSGAPVAGAISTADSFLSTASHDEIGVYDETWDLPATTTGWYDPQPSVWAAQPEEHWTGSTSATTTPTSEYKTEAEVAWPAATATAPADEIWAGSQRLSQPWEQPGGLAMISPLRGGVKRGRSDSLDDRESFAMAKLPIQLRYGNGTEQGAEGW
jgi:transcriptional enhancer factor